MMPNTPWQRSLDRHNARLPAAAMAFAMSSKKCNDQYGFPEINIHSVHSAYTQRTLHIPILKTVLI